jgi:hypothetical protein
MLVGVVRESIRQLWLLFNLLYAVKGGGLMYRGSNYLEYKGTLGTFALHVGFWLCRPLANVDLWRLCFLVVVMLDGLLEW